MPLFTVAPHVAAVIALTALAVAGIIVANLFAAAAPTSKGGATCGRRSGLTLRISRLRPSLADSIVTAAIP
jgi:hypothetical protein